MEKKLKWFSYLNDNPKMLNEYFEYYKVAVYSQTLNCPSLEPYLIYDGSNEDVISFCERKNIKIINFTPRIKEEIIKHYEVHQPTQVFDALACFLKPYVPLIVKEILKSDDEYVILTDSDVIFFNEPNYTELNKIDYIGVSSEFDINLSDFNAGIMYFNVENMYNDFEDFEKFIVKNFSKFQVFDQDAFKIYYNNRTKKLPIEYNYKCYWNYSKSVNDIKILHFHGLKPYQYMDLLTGKNTNPVLKPMLTPFYIEMVGYYKSLRDIEKKS
jgi:lipopolysaccharide biosynthesis glycosyltransferase